jgi:hypothetical protein
MSISPFVKMVSLLVAVISIEVLFLEAMQRKDSPQIPELSTQDSAYPVVIKGLRSESHRNGTIASKLKADLLKVTPRKFFIFNIRPFNELNLNNAVVELHMYTDSLEDTSRGSKGSLQANMLFQNGGKAFMKQTGVITRGLIDNLTFKIYKNGSLSFLAKANKAYIDFKKDEVKLENATIQDISSKRLIRSKLIVWKNKESVFTVPGQYIIFSHTGPKKGHGIKIEI